MGTGIHTDDEFQNVFAPIVDEVMKLVTDRAYNLLIDHINKEVYGTGVNIMYEPTYEFRDKAWVKNIQAVAGAYVKKYIGAIEYTPSMMQEPTSAYPYRHGYYEYNIDNRDVLADLLNVEGVAKGMGNKQRHLFWDNYEKELSQKVGQWLYTEFNKKGIKIPALKFLKPEGWCN